MMNTDQGKIGLTHTQLDVAHLYRLTSPSGKSYFGIAKNVKKRWQEHAASARNGIGYSLHKSIRKYGFENFKNEILVTSTTEYIKDLEIKAIAAYGTMKNGYNLTGGGDGLLNIVVTPERRKKQSESQKGKTFSDVHRLRISLSNKGKKMPEEQKAKISTSLSLVVRSDEWKRNISLSKKGVAQTDKAKKARSESQRLKWQDPEYRAKQLELQRLGAQRKRSDKNAV